MAKAARPRGDFPASIDLSKAFLLVDQLQTELDSIQDRLQGPDDQAHARWLVYCSTQDVGSIRTMLDMLTSWSAPIRRWTCANCGKTSSAYAARPFAPCSHCGYGQTSA